MLERGAKHIKVISCGYLAAKLIRKSQADVVDM
jgi:hypothetical protein